MRTVVRFLTTRWRYALRTEARLIVQEAVGKGPDYASSCTFEGEAEHPPRFCSSSLLNLFKPVNGVAYC